MSIRPPSALRERRLLSGWSQDQLARHVGVSRQALNALERGHAQPSVETALALAAVLGTTVEALFGKSHPAPLALPTRVGPPGTRLLLAEVDGRVRGHALDPSSGEPADALVEHPNRPPTLLETERWRRTLLVAGCDPALRMLALRSGNARWINAGTGKAVELLVRRQVHVVGVHSLTERDRRRGRVELAPRPQPGLCHDASDLVEALHAVPGLPDARLVAGLPAPQPGARLPRALRGPLRAPRPHLVRYRGDPRRPG